jgi:broad specificity phosphatase PhoE
MEYLGKAQGISDIPLNKEGRNQAIALTNSLTREEWTWYELNKQAGKFHTAL